VDVALYAAQQKRASALLRQISLKQNYFGEAQNFVTLLSEKVYSDTLDRMLALAADIEKAYLAYDFNVTQNAKAVATALASKQTYLQVIDDKRTEKQSATTQYPELLASVKTLDAERNERWAALLAAEIAFQEAAEAQANNCDYGRILGIAAACVTLVASGGTAIAAVGAAGAVFKEGAKTDDDKAIPSGIVGFNYRVNKVETASGSIQAYAEAAQKLNSKLEPQRVGDVMKFPNDDAKILTTQDDLDKQLVPFLDLPEAQKYKQAIHEFTAIATARNNKIVELNLIVTRLASVDGEIAQATLEADRLQDAASRAVNPFYIDAAAFMERAWQDSLSNVVRVLARLHAAYKYYALDDDSSLTIDDFSVASLSYARLSLLAKYTSAKASTGSRPARLEAKTLNLSEVIGAKGIKRLQQKRAVSFVLDPNHALFKDLSNVLVSGLEVNLSSTSHDIRTFSLTITHHGRGLVFDEDGRSHIYSHVPVRVPFARVDGRTTDFGDIGSADYVGVSPYGPWTIVLNTKTQLPLLTEIAFVMRGYGRARRSKQVSEQLALV
jgi:hypothetical protein